MSRRKKNHKQKHMQKINVFFLVQKFHTAEITGYTVFTKHSKYKTKDWANRTPLKAGGSRCFGKVSNSCSISATHRNGTWYQKNKLTIDVTNKFE